MQQSMEKYGQLTLVAACRIVQGEGRGFLKAGCAIRSAPPNPRPVHSISRSGRGKPPGCRRQCGQGCLLYGRGAGGAFAATRGLLEPAR